MVMEKKWIKDLGVNECIQASTKDISDKLCKKFDELGLKWRDGGSYIEDDYFSNYIDKINYIPFDGTFCLTDYIESHYKVYTINDLLDFEGEEFSVSDESYTKEEIELLDRFAMLAMNGILSSETEMRANGGMYGEQTKSSRLLSDECYSIAKEMLRARKEVLKSV